MATWGSAIAGARAASARASRGVLQQALSRSAIPVWASLAGIAAAIVAVAALGAFDDAEPAPQLLAVGETATVPQYSITVLDGELTNTVEEQYLEAEPGDVLAVLTVRIENLSERPIGLGTTTDRLRSRLINSSDSLLEISGVETTDSTTAWRADGSSGSVILQPRVPAEVRIAWPVPADSFPDGVLELDVHEARIVTGQVLLSADTITWRQAALVARIPVELGGGS